MAKDEVELGGEGAGDDYEVVPVGPIRKLERRIDEMEEKAQKGGMGGTDDELVRDVLDIMKSNQKIVNDMTESTHELKNSVEDLTHKMDEVIDDMNNFMDLLQEASEADLEGEVIQDVHSRIADAVGDRMQDVAEDMRESNDQVIQHLEELNKSVKRSYASENKEQVLSGGSQRQRQRGSGRQRQDSQSQGRGLNVQRDGGSQEGNQAERQQGSQNTQGQEGRNSDRMRKLRKRFDKMEDET